MNVKAIFVLALALSTVRLEAVVRCSETSRQSLSVTSGQAFQLPVVTVPGALDYDIQRAASWTIVPSDIWLFKGEILSTRLRPATGAAPNVAETLVNTDPEFPYAIYYVATATNISDASFQPCAQDFVVNVAPDPLLARDSTRIIVPVVGSLRGANDSIFRTRVVMENLLDTPIGGVLVFHPSGGGTATSLRYTLPAKASKVYDDVVVALGTVGLGSLDVMPDRTPSGYLAPRITAHLNSVAASGGFFGTDVPAVSMSDREFGAVWTSANWNPSVRIEDPSSNRYNIGIRSLADEVSLTALLFDAAGVQKTSVQHSFPADFHQQMPISTFLGTSVSPGDSIQFIAIRKSGLVGGAIIYLASTDNITNDVRLDVPRAPEVFLQQPMVACSPGVGCRQIAR